MEGLISSNLCLCKAALERILNSSEGLPPYEEGVLVIRLIGLGEQDPFLLLLSTRKVR